MGGGRDKGPASPIPTGFPACFHSLEKSAVLHHSGVHVCVRAPACGCVPMAPVAQRPMRGALHRSSGPECGHVPGAAGLAPTLTLDGLPTERGPWVQPAGGACLVSSWASSITAGHVAQGKEPAWRPAWVPIAALSLASRVVGVAGAQETPHGPVSTRTPSPGSCQPSARGSYSNELATFLAGQGL